MEIKARPRAFIQPWTGVSGSMYDATFSHSRNALRWAATSKEDCFVLYSPMVLKLRLFRLSRLGLILDSVSGDGLRVLVGQSELASAYTELC